jgi:hypothetical protein
MANASRWSKRTHKDKTTIFSEIGHFHHRLTHSEYRYWLQWVAAIRRVILANFARTPSVLSQNWPTTVVGPRAEQKR